MHVASKTVILNWIADQIVDAPKPSYQYPLAYTSWGTDEIFAAIECLCDQRTTMWRITESFESQFTDYIGASQSVMVNSGSSADFVMMLAARETGLLRPGDEILIPAVTWPTQVWAAVEAGFKVKLVDVEVASLNTSAEILEAAITPQTKAIFLVHLMGNPCQMDAIADIAKRHGLLIFEDCCEALGAEFNGRNVGTFGLASTFSFFASHHITTMEGGMISTSDEDFADMCRCLRAHGWARDLQSSHINYDFYDCDDRRYFFVKRGFNFRPTELSAAFGRIQLAKLPEMNRRREQNFHLAWQCYPKVEQLQIINPKARAAWFALPFVLKEGIDRKWVKGRLEVNGVDTRPILGGNLMRHPAFMFDPAFRNERWSLPGADAIHDRGFYIGLPPFEEQISGLIQILRDTLN